MKKKFGAQHKVLEKLLPELRLSSSDDAVLQRAFASDSPLLVLGSWGRILDWLLEDPLRLNEVQLAATAAMPLRLASAMHHMQADHKLTPEEAFAMPMIPQEMLRLLDSLRCFQSDLDKLLYSEEMRACYDQLRLLAVEQNVRDTIPELFDNVMFLLISAKLEGRAYMEHFEA